MNYANRYNYVCMILSCFLLCLMSIAFELNAQDALELVESVQDESQESPLLWLGLFLLGCFLLAGKHAYTQIWRKNSLSAKDAQQLREKQQRMLQTLAELDEKYESGQLDKQVYARERARRKQELVELALLCRSLKVKS